MEEKKIYTPGQYDRIVRERQRAQDANAAKFNKSGNRILLSRCLLDSIDMLLIPFVEDDKIGFINKLGETVVEPKYDEVSGDMRSEDSFVSVCKDKVWNVINYQGKELLDNKVTSIIKPGYDCPLATIQNQKESQVINVLTNAVLVNGEYDYIGGFRYGFARVRKNGLWGIINDQGQLVVEPQYTDMYRFYEWKEPTTVVKTADGQSTMIDLYSLNKSQKDFVVKKNCTTGL